MSAAPKPPTPKPPLVPQLARSAKRIPTGDDWAYEPKYDGFRALVFSGGEEPFIQSRGGKPLGRYFPELDLPAGDYVLDGELVILDDDGAEVFDALQNRIHPAESRINRLAEETPVRFRAFDLLARDGRSLMEAPFAERRSALVELVSGAAAATEAGPGGWTAGSVELTPLTLDPDAAAPWLESGEGVIAKLLDSPYLPGKRTAMVKVKRIRTIDAVVAGWRPGKEPDTVGSLMLGLYDGDELRVIGHTSGLKAAEKRELVQTLAPYETGDRGSADPSRWAGDRDLEWVSLRPELVIEVSFDHVSAGRIRHGARILRWREDKPPEACTIDQLEQ
ncbi:MAG TPA: ATP-dependent DNA ligase [Solirubrobacterales bacterium]|nr:ATP-dependent DNA ligase [Solirubrobacterales bacterium]